MEFFFIIYKTGIDCAKEKMKVFSEIVDLLCKNTKEKSKEDLINQALKNENETLHSKIEQIEKENCKKAEENKALTDQIQILKNKINKITKESSQKTDENNRLKSFLYALKEKSKSLNFFELNEYKSDGILGQGATSSVKIVHKTEKEKYAQKELRELTFKSMKRFLFECEILFKLRHPCIIRVFGFNIGNETIQPSMILSLEPTSLEKAIQDKILNKHQKNRIVIELVLGMRYIHKHNFIHRDLKPSNILLSKNMHVRICDFGLARDESLSTTQSKGIGTLRFMAPELFEENDIKYNNKVDVYAFGITLIYIINDNYPAFSMKNVINGVTPKIAESIVGWVRDLIIRCLALSPDKRPSFTEIFEIMKSHNYDMFNDNKSVKLKTNDHDVKEIENRILKIEAFEYQHQNE